MRRIAALAALALAGCASGADVRESGDDFVPAFLSKRYSDGTLSFRYPGWWLDRGRIGRWGVVIRDDRSSSPAFVSIRYLPARTYATNRGFAREAGRRLRLGGRGLTLLYTQTAVLGGRRGIEAAFVWQREGRTPVGPTMRAFGVTLPSGRVALLVFVAERPPVQAATFAWIKKTIEWSGG